MAMVDLMMTKRRRNGLNMNSLCEGESTSSELKGDAKKEMHYVRGSMCKGELYLKFLLLHPLFCHHQKGGDCSSQSVSFDDDKTNG